MDGYGADPLVLARRKDSGRFVVRDEVGALRAQISVPWRGSSFAVTEPDGRTLCAGALGMHGLSSTWKVTGVDGRALLTTHWRWTGTSARVTLERGGELLPRTSLWKQGFTLIDAEGVEVARAAPATGRRLRRRDYVVRQLEPTLDVAELIPVAQIWCMTEDAAFVAAA